MIIALLNCEAKKISRIDIHHKSSCLIFVLILLSVILLVWVYVAIEYRVMLRNLKSHWWLLITKLTMSRILKEAIIGETGNL